jgi:hypothetical protein
MLARWEEEDVSGEPDWDIEDIEPMRFSGYWRTTRSDGEVTG